MVKQVDEFEGRRLDIREEVVAGSGKECSNGVCSNFLLNRNRAVDFEHLVQVNIFKVDFRVAIDIICDRDCIGRGGSRCEGGCGLGVRN